MDIIGDMIVDVFTCKKEDDWFYKHPHLTIILTIFIYPGSQIIACLIFT
jgi:hypothetical protein